MPVLNVEVDTLLLADPTRSRTTVHVHVAHPTALEESTFGKLYIITEVESTGRTTQDILAALQDDLKSAYYRSEDTNLETAFEAALQHANRRLHAFIAEGVTDWVNGFHAVIAVVRNDLVMFSHLGHMQGFLFRGNRITDAIGKQGGSEKPNLLKIFSSVFTGHLQAQDRLLFCTSSVLDFFSQEKLKRLVMENLPSDTLSSIEQILLSSTTPIAFAAILFAFLPNDRGVPATVENPQQPITMQVGLPQRSMDELILKERTTEELLSPSIMPNIRTIFTTASGWLQNFVRTKVFRRPHRRRTPYSLQASTRYTAPPQLQSFRKTLTRGFMAAIIGLASMLRFIGSLGRKRREVASDVRAIPVRTTNAAARFVRWLTSLNNVQRILLLLSLVALFVFSQSIISQMSRKTTTLRGQEAEQAYQTITDNISRASASLIYGDVAGARKLYAESRSLFDTLAKTKKDASRRESLQQQLSTLRDKVRLVATPNIHAIADLRSALHGARPSSMSFTQVGGFVVTVSESDALITVSSDGKSINTATAPFTPSFVVSTGSKSFLLGGSDGTLAELQLPNTIRPISVIWSSDERHIVAGATFQSRLYLLDTVQGTILRLNRGGTAYGTPTTWLKSNADSLKSGSGLAVDGSIFITTSQGVLQRYTAGVVDDVAFETLDPVLKAPVQIWTSESSQKLYVLDPSEQRLAIFNKTSRRLIVQYVDAALSNATAFAVNEKTSTLSFLTPDGISAFSLASS